MEPEEPDPRDEAPRRDRRLLPVPERLQHKPVGEMGSAYQGAMEAVLSIVIALLLGWWADGAFETAPWGMVVGATIGFAAFVLRLSRLRPAEEPPSAQDGGAPMGSDAGSPEEPDEREASRSQGSHDPSRDGER